MQLNVLKYSSLQSFLYDFAKHSKKERPSWSVSGWAKRLQLKSTTSINMIINGQRNCGPSISAALIKYFNFSENEKKHFKYLVEKSKIDRDSPTLNLIDNEIMSGIKSKHQILLTDDQLNRMSHSHYFALRQLARILPLQRNEDWLRTKMNYKGKAKLLEAADELFKLGFLTESGGQYVADEILLLSKTDVSNESIKQYHEEMGALAIEAIRKYDVTERDFQGCTLKIKKDKIELAKNLIEKFMSDFESLTDCSDGNAIYQLNLQFFPMVAMNEN